MPDPTGVSIAALSLMGVLYTARQSWRLGDHDQHRADFNAILAAQDTRMTHMQRRLDAEAAWRRAATRYIRQLVTCLREQDIEPPRMPDELDADLPL